MSIFSLRTNTQVFIEDFKKVTKIKKTYYFCYQTNLFKFLIQYFCSQTRHSTRNLT